MRIETDVKLDFKDVLIRPKRSTLNSRNEVDIHRAFRFYHTGVGMEGLSAHRRQHGRDRHDGDGARARQARRADRAAQALSRGRSWPSSSPATTARTRSIRSARPRPISKSSPRSRKRAPLRFLCIDVANGYAEKFLDTVKRVRDENPKSVIMAGNVVTGDMTEALILAGADIVKIGIGPGSVCTTRRVTGVGYPQLSAIIECADAAHGLKGQVCADGGCTVPGDVAKAYGAGADFVMLGGMLAGHDECDGEIRYEERDGETRAGRA